MENRIIPKLLMIFTVTVSTTLVSFGQLVHDEPWTENQLLSPVILANIINTPNAHQPIIYSIGPGAIIKGSIDIGPTGEKGNLQKLKLQLSKLPKDADIVIYCGCCPFERCPNIRPAFQLLNDMKFMNHKLLALRKSIKADWMDRGYPIVK